MAVVPACSQNSETKIPERFEGWVQPERTERGKPIVTWTVGISKELSKEV